MHLGVGRRGGGVEREGCSGYTNPTTRKALADHTSLPVSVGSKGPPKGISSNEDYKSGGGNSYQ